MTVKLPGSLLLLLSPSSLSPSIPIHRSVATLKSTALTEQALLICRFAKNILAVWHVLSMAACCIRMYTVCIEQGGDTVILKFLVILCRSYRAYSYN